MRVLVVGGGGREHCLAWKMAGSQSVSEVIVAPGNAGTSAIGRNVPVSPENISGLVEIAGKEGVGLVVVGPEVPLTLGLVDRLEEVGIPAFGPNAEAARLEGSKAFAKKVMHENGIPTSNFEVFEEYDAALAYLKGKYGAGREMVVKADGLAAGKGVFVPEGLQEAEEALHLLMVKGALKGAGKRVVIEEKVTGEEVSVLALSDGKTVVPLLTSQDHKRIGDGDTGPNTGGMGAYAPVPRFGSDFIQQVQTMVLEPTVKAMADAGALYKGVLYAGLMIGNGIPYVLEYNVRFGDPETQAIIPLLKSDLAELCMACIDQRLDEAMLEWRKGFAMTVVAASGGYPGDYEKGKPIHGLSKLDATPDVEVFHAGTSDADGQVVTSGGRVLNVVGIGDTLKQAALKAYEGVGRLHFEGMYYRHDIGWRALE